MRQVFALMRTGKGLPTFGAATLAWMILVVLEGAVVRATGSGAGCGAHWPLCNGEILPHHPRLATVIEFTHRSMTGVCSALTVALIAWTFLAHPNGTRVRRAAVWSGLLLFTEAILGAVLVKGGFVERNTSNMRVFIQGVHFTNTLLLLAALSLCWWWQRPRVQAAGRVSQARSAALLALGAMIITGATGSVAALSDTLFPAANLHAALVADFASSSPLIIRVRWMHPAASFLACAAILGLAWLRPAHRRPLVLLLVAQVVLGVADVLWLAPLSLQVLHLLAADLLWAALVIASSEVLLSPSSSTAARPLAFTAQGRTQRA